MSRELPQLLEETALYMSLLGENTFKARAYENAASIVEGFSDDELKKKIQDGTLVEIKGIGPSLRNEIEEYYKTGSLTLHDDLRKKVPSGVLELVKVPGLGPKKAYTIYEKLGISTIGELEYACKENRLMLLSGFGEKTQAKILKNLEFLKKHQQTFLFSDASLEFQILSSFFKTHKMVNRYQAVGSLKRKREIVKNIDVVVEGNVGEKQTSLFRDLGSHASIAQTVSVKGADGVSGSEAIFNLKSGIRLCVRVFGEKEFPFAVRYFTGSLEHNLALAAFAGKKGMILSATGLISKGKPVAASNEKEIFQKLGLPFIEPELREDRGEIEAASKENLPVLVERDQLRGFFHCHTTDSDGTNSLEEMVETAQNLGFEYIGISDHSASAGYAHGMRKDRVLDQFKRIEALQKKFKIRILKGVESDILTDGRLDYEDEVLKKFDFVIGSVHSVFSQSKELMTKRVLKAISNPYLDFLGHPTGRLLLARDGFDMDMHQVITAASKAQVAIEINAHPQRLDLDWRYGLFLKENGGRVSINPDAHSMAGIEDVEFGVGIARKAWLSSKEVLNTLPANKILGSLRRARRL